MAQQHVAQKRHVGIDHQAARLALERQPIALQRSAHRAVMNPEMSRNGFLAPAFDLVKSADLGHHPRRDHDAPPLKSEAD